MWPFDDASGIGASDMDRRAWPSPSYGDYGVGFDACDPLGSVLEWSGRGECRAAKVLRRRCRSEGVERSPYEDAHIDAAEYHYRSHNRTLPTKSHFTLNNGHADRFMHECSLPYAENGDYLMAHEKQCYQASLKSKSNHKKTSPTRPLIVHSPNPKMDKSRLPKVEELFEKTDQDMIMETAISKQPFKSILNHPAVQKSPPPGILKKPKGFYQDPQKGMEGRRRQRAASESDNLYCTHMGSPIAGYDSRLNYLSSSTKRAKDNSGTGYSYGSAVAMSSPALKTSYKPKCSCKDQVAVGGNNQVHILRTTTINDMVPDDNVVEMPRFDTLAPTCPVVSPALPVNSATDVPVPKKVIKKKLRVKPRAPKSRSPETINLSPESCDIESHDRPPTPDDPTWHMETDSFIAEVDKIEKSLPSLPAVNSVNNIKKEKAEVAESNSATKNTSKANGEVVPKKKAVKDESQLNVPEIVSTCLRQSLFPRVPPYLKFVGHEDPVLKIPAGIGRHLKWKLTTITPIVVKRTLTNSGFRLVKSECDTSECPQEETVDWIGIWGKHMKSLMFRAIKDGQKMNHFPGTFQIGRKDRLWRNLQKLTNKYGLKEFGIMPKTYVLPHDMKLLKHDWEKYAADDERWIIKPPASARGTGIKVVSRWTQIPKKRPVVVQRYVSKPYLINGSKFDMRLYVLITSIHPLRIYLYKDGLARFASVKYTDELTSLNDRYMHLTNYSINRLSKNYTPNEDFAACEGHKWTLQSLFHYLKTEKQVNTEALWESMKDLVIKTIISGEASISSLTKANITSRYNCYELFGIDVLLDEDLKPWLLEVNISPSLHSASPLDIHVKGPLVSSVLNIAQFQVPLNTNLESLTKEKPHKLAGLPYDSRLYTIYLSKEERDKHIIYTNMEERDMYLRDILSTLTSDDVRHLIQAEDELTQSGDMERIFPTKDTHKYLNYLNGARYYNRLFDAWETRYHRDRSPGVDMLRNLCDIGYHLEVPPVPLKVYNKKLAYKCGSLQSAFDLPRGNNSETTCCLSYSENDIDAPSPPASERPSVVSIEVIASATPSPTRIGDNIRDATNACVPARA